MQGRINVMDVLSIKCGWVIQSFFQLFKCYMKIAFDRQKLLIETQSFLDNWSDFLFPNARFAK